MPNIKTLERHSRLVNRMAEIAGIDLDLRLMTGTLAPERIDGAVLACTGCAEAGECERAMGRGAMPAIPHYCRNTALFEDLIREG